MTEQRAHFDYRQNPAQRGRASSRMRSDEWARPKLFRNREEQAKHFPKSARRSPASTGTGREGSVSAQGVRQVADLIERNREGVGYLRVRELACR